MHVPADPRRRRPARGQARPADRQRGRDADRSASRSAGVAPQDVNVLFWARAAPARSWSPAPSTTIAAAAGPRSWRSTARPSRSRCWKASCSATSAGRSPGPTAGGSASSSRPTAARCCWTRSATWPRAPRPRFCGCLQEGTFERLGGSEPITTDVRIIAATNQDLDAMIERGRFRKDLYYRLRGVTIHLPPLREHREDIAELAHYFHVPLQSATRHGRAVDFSRRPGVVGEVRLARKRARAAERAPRGA